MAFFYNFYNFYNFFAFLCSLDFFQPFRPMQAFSGTFICGGTGHKLGHSGLFSGCGIFVNYAVFTGFVDFTCNSAQIPNGALIFTGFGAEIPNHCLEARLKLLASGLFFKGLSLSFFFAHFFLFRPGDHISNHDPRHII